MMVNQLFDLGFSAWVNKEEGGGVSFIYIEFTPKLLDINIFIQSIHDVAATIKLFSKQINSKGFLEVRNDTQQSLILKVTKTDRNPYLYRQAIINGTDPYLADTKLSDSVFLQINIIEFTSELMQVSFLAHMAVIDPVTLYGFITAVAKDYENKKSSCHGLFLYQDAMGAIDLQNNDVLIIDPSSSALANEQKLKQLSEAEVPGLAWKFINPKQNISKNLCFALNKASYEALQRNADNNKVDIGILVKAIFCLSLALFSENLRFRLSLPYFKKFTSIHADGAFAFSDFTIEEVDMDFNSSLFACVQQFAYQKNIDSKHGVSGVQLLRQLSEYTHKIEIAPVVYTDLTGYGELFGGTVKKHLGNPTFCLSRGAGVAIDMQVAFVDGLLYSNWDINTDYIEATLARSLYSVYVKLLCLYANDPATWHLSLTEVSINLGVSRSSATAMLGHGIKIAGRTLSLERIRQLLCCLLNCPVRPMFYAINNQQDGLILLIDNKLSNLVPIQDIKNLIRSSFLAQLNFQEILFIPPEAFNRLVDKQWLSGFDLDEFRIKQEKEESPLLLIKILGLMFSRVLNQTVDPMRDKDTDFFAMGGNSLLGTQLVAEINKYFIFSITTIADLFRLRSMNEIAQHIFVQNPQESQRIAQLIMQLMTKAQRN